MQTKRVWCVDCGEIFDIPDYAVIERMGNIEYYRCFDCKQLLVNKYNKKNNEKYHEQLKLFEVTER